MSTIQNAKTQSTATFVTALWLNAAVFAIELVAFTLLRKRFKAIYEPRAYIPPENKRASPLATRLLAWPIAVFKSDYDDIKRQNGMDAYFYVRFLRMMVKILLPIWLVSWAILLPLAAVNSNNGRSGLDRFTFGNIGPSDQPRLAGHLILMYLFTIWIIYNIKNEMRNFITTRQRHLVDPVHSASAQANTMLLTGVPTKYLSEHAITDLFSHLPGGVRKVWLNRDLKELPDLHDRRMQASNKLESAETALLKTAAKLHKKLPKSQSKGEQAQTGAAGLQKKTRSSEDAPVSPDYDAENMSVARAEVIVPEKDRPSHRMPAGFLPFALPFIGKKVDTINWARDEIRGTTEALERGRAVLKREAGDELARQQRTGGVVGFMTRHRSASSASSSDDEFETGKSKARHEKTTPVGPAAPPASAPVATGSGEEALVAQDKATEDETYPPLNSAFVLFNTQIAAHLAAQTLTHHEPYRMADKFTEVAPADVIWGNLGLNPYEMKIRRVTSYAMTAALIIFWAIPVAFVGVISNVANLCATYSWLAWLCKLPKPVIGILQGVLPPVLLAVLMMLLPIVLRRLAQFEGIPRRTGVELSLMTRYFLFQVVHSFLIVTLASGIIAALPELVGNPTSIPTILASNLPQASNFFLTYIVLQGLSGTAAGFLQIVPLIVYYVKLFLLGSTPRSVYNIKYMLRGVQWGTLFPATTLLVVITITYSVISPIINGLACATFFLFYQLWKYLFLYQLDQPAAGDTGGLFFPKAIQHVFVGLYIQQICLAALFFLARDATDKASAIPEGALAIVLVVITALFHIILNNSYGPLLHALPLSLANKSHGIRNLVRESTDGNDAHHPHVNPATGKQTVRTDAADYEKMSSVPVEGKRNEEPADFYHPASVEPARIIWIPHDTLGLGQAEVEENRALGVDASTEHASMDAKGHVDIDGHPPGMLVNDL